MMVFAKMNKQKPNRLLYRKTVCAVEANLSLYIAPPSLPRPSGYHRVPVLPPPPAPLPVDTPFCPCCESRRSLGGGRGDTATCPLKHSTSWGRGAFFLRYKKKIMKEISMQNDEHGPVDTSRLFCWLFLCNSVFIALHLSHFISLFSATLDPSVSLSLLHLSLSRSVLPQASKATSKVAEPTSGLGPLWPCPTCPTRPPCPTPPCSCSLGSGDAPCMSPQPWIVTTRNNRNKVNKSEKK